MWPKIDTETQNKERSQIGVDRSMLNSDAVNALTGPRPRGVLDIVLDAAANHDDGFPRVNGGIVAKARWINIAFLSSVQLGEFGGLSLSSTMLALDV